MKKLQMSCLVMDLVVWNEMEIEEEPFKTFLSCLDQAPSGSPTNKFRHTELVIKKIKGIVIESEYGVSKSDLENKIAKKIFDVTKGGNDIKAVRTLLASKDLNDRPRVREFVKKKIHDLESQEPKLYPMIGSRQTKELDCEKCEGHRRIIEIYKQDPSKGLVTECCRKALEAHVLKSLQNLLISAN